MTFQRTIDDGQQPAPAARPVAPAPPPPAAPERIGLITHVAADVAWPSGAAPLARWLRSNPGVLGDLLGMTLEGTSDEVPGGLAASVFVDPAGTRTLAALELGPSSEAMLGAMLTRLSAAQAGSAVWICGEPRDEHLSAVSWLNHSVATRFYVARVRAARIGSSEPAPILELVLRPPRGSAAPVTAKDAEAERTRRAGDHTDTVLERPTA